MNILRSAVTGFRAALRGVWAGGTGWLLIVIGAGWALSVGIRFVFPALIPFLRTEFGIGLSTTGLLLTLLWGAYAIGHVPGGILGDRIGEGNILVVSAALSTAAVLVVAIATNTTLLFVAAITFGVATALYGPTRFTILTDLYPQRAGSAIGLTMAAGNVANAVFPVIAAVVAGAVSWRLGFAMFAPLFALVTLAIWLSVPGRTSGGTSTVDEFSRETLRRLRTGISSGEIPVVVAIQVSSSFMIQGFTSFYPAYLIDAKGLSPGTAAALFGGFFAIGALIQPTSGTLMDRVGIRTALTGLLGLCTLALWLLPFAEGLPALVGVTALFATWSGTGVVTQTYIADTLPSEMQGTGLGILKASWMLLGATAPLTVGFLADAGLFDEAFLLLGLAGSVGVVLAGTRL